MISAGHRQAARDCDRVPGVESPRCDVRASLYFRQPFDGIYVVLTWPDAEDVPTRLTIHRLRRVKTAAGGRYGIDALGRHAPAGPIDEPRNRTSVWGGSFWLPG